LFPSDPAWATVKIPIPQIVENLLVQQPLLRKAAVARMDVGKRKNQMVRNWFDQRLLIIDSHAHLGVVFSHNN